MRSKEQTTTVQESNPAQEEHHAPRKLSLAENLILTIKVLLGFGALGAALWGISLWKSAS
jgi:hypothetical protein